MNVVGLTIQICLLANPQPLQLESFLRKAIKGTFWTPNNLAITLAYPEVDEDDSSLRPLSVDFVYVSFPFFHLLFSNFLPYPYLDFLTLLSRDLNHGFVSPVCSLSFKSSPQSSVCMLPVRYSINSLHVVCLIVHWLFTHGLLHVWLSHGFSTVCFTLDLASFPPFVSWCACLLQWFLFVTLYF